MIFLERFRACRECGTFESMPIWRAPVCQRCSEPKPAARPVMHATSPLASRAVSHLRYTDEVMTMTPETIFTTHVAMHPRRES